MKIIFYINGQKTTRKNLNEFIGRAAVRDIVLIAKEIHFVKGVSIRAFNMGSYGDVIVVFKQDTSQSKE